MERSSSHISSAACSAFLRISFVFLFVVTAALPLQQAHAGPTTLNVTLPKEGLPRGIVLSVSTLDLQTGVVIDNFSTKPRRRVTAQCDPRFCLTSIRGTAVVKNRGKRTVQQFLGISKGYGGEVQAAATRVISVAKRKSATVANLVRSVHGLPSRAALGQIRIGVPGSGFTINKELANLIGSPANLASTVTTTLVQSPCYKSDGSYQVLEVDPRLLGERKKELNLIKKGYVKGDPSVSDKYAKPDHSVRGSVSQTGSSATATVQITNSAGQVIASSTGTSANGGWFEALNQAALDLAGQLCDGPKVNIALAQCFLRECSCGSNSFGYRIDLRVEGVAKLPVNGLLYTTVPSDGSITQSCGGASPSTFGGVLACRRTAEPEPESFEYSFTSLDPVSPSCSCPREGAPSSLPFLATAIDLATGERDDAILESVPCVVTP